MCFLMSSMSCNEIINSSFKTKKSLHIAHVRAHINFYNLFEPHEAECHLIHPIWQFWNVSRAEVLLLLSTLSLATQMTFVSGTNLKGPNHICALWKLFNYYFSAQQNIVHFAMEDSSCLIFGCVRKIKKKRKPNLHASSMPICRKTLDHDLTTLICL